MNWHQLTIAILAGFTMFLVATVIRRPDLLRHPWGGILAMVSLLVLPLFVFTGGTAQHIETSKATEFCLSCHVMEPYGRSLNLASTEHLPAAHFQNHQIPREQACYTCHTNYAMFGDIKAKLSGLEHLWVYYFGEIPKEIQLYQPYQNRECLHCHEGARSFLEARSHEEVFGEMKSGELSCLECHDEIHSAAEVQSLDLWAPK